MIIGDSKKQSRQGLMLDGAFVITYHAAMTLFFIIYWGGLLALALGVRSFQSYHRQHVLRHEYAERHRASIRRYTGGLQHKLF